MQPILISQKLELGVQKKQVQPPIMNQHCMVNSFSYDLCNADHVGYTSRHLHQCDIDHNKLAIHKQLLEAHGSLCHLNYENQLRILRKRVQTWNAL